MGGGVEVKAGRQDKQEEYFVRLLNILQYKKAQMEVAAKEGVESVSKG